MYYWKCTECDNECRVEMQEYDRPDACPVSGELVRWITSVNASDLPREHEETSCKADSQGATD